MRRTVPIKVVATVRTIGVIVALVWMLAVTYQSTRTISTPGKIRTIVQQVNRPTVQESRVRISRSIKRYTRDQLRQLLGRLLKSATPKQLRLIARVTGPVRPNRQAPNSTSNSSPNLRSRPHAHASPGHATKPSPSATRAPSSPTPRPTPAAAVTPNPTAAAVVAVEVIPTAIPPLAGVTVPLPVRVCAVVSVNCTP
jgi:hypothetical protein